MNFKQFIANLNHQNFDEKALELFRWQATNNVVYQKYLKLLKKETNQIKHIHQIPHLPVELFKYHKVICSSSQLSTTSNLTFKSSGTSLDSFSQHFVLEPEIYHYAIANGFEQFYGDPQNYCILALLPSYIEQGNSSLVYMVDYLMQLSQHPNNNFFLYNFKKLSNTLTQLEKKNQPTLLIGVSYALLDFAEQYPIPLKNTIIMETGGMKGRRKEITQAELHQHLKTAFKVNKVHSEYGMTELLSQSYSIGDGKFETSSTQKIIIKDVYDPFATIPNGQSGRINVIDLANFSSCAFIQTSDLGKLHNDGSFEVLGRIDNSDIRGCNLML